MAEILKWALSVLTGSAAVGAFFVYLLKTSIEAKLKESVDLRLQTLKDSNARDLEAYKTELSSQSAVELERLKAELAKASWHAEQTGTRLQEVYPELFKQVRVAEGLTAGLWGARWVGDLTHLDQDEIEEKLKEWKVSNQERDDVLGNLAGDP